MGCQGPSKHFEKYSRHQKTNIILYFQYMQAWLLTFKWWVVHQRTNSLDDAGSGWYTHPPVSILLGNQQKRSILLCPTKVICSFLSPTYPHSIGYQRNVFEKRQTFLLFFLHQRSKPFLPIGRGITSGASTLAARELMWSLYFHAEPLVQTFIIMKEES